MHLKQKTELPSHSPPRIRPRITGARSQTVANPEREISPTKENMRQALQAQTAPSGQVLKTIRLFLFLLLISKKFIVIMLTVNSTHIRCIIYPTAYITFLELVANARPFDAVRDCLGAQEITLMYNLRAKPKYGAFKQAIFGYFDRPALWSSTSVAIKQTFYIKPTTGVRVLHDKHTQLKKISTELNCLRWASALMGIVYSFINDHKSTTGLSPSFQIPEMAFVKSALAISETDQEVFLLEEVIDEALEGPFIKYIGNGSVRPYDYLEGEWHRLGEFLTFCQHVQFLKTKELAFVGDFQGKHKHWLTKYYLTCYIFYGLQVEDIYLQIHKS
jgi:hypothetical protein